MSNNTGLSLSKRTKSSDTIITSNKNGLSLADRTKSVDIISVRIKDHQTALTTGQDDGSSSGTGGFRVGELVLSNGESYSGSLLGNIPEGFGKYLWSYGCKYEGEWRRGVRHGFGKIQWPSGAFYEGNFSGGYMFGTGTYIRLNKMIYKGRWRLSLKHGLGYQTYPNGDIFEGNWMQGNPEGPGTYTWKNGNVYLGQMKGGKMCGKGTLTWTSGDSYEGSWLKGMMHGFGVYTWNDNGCYVGTWTRGLKDGKGTYYPNGSRLPAIEEVYLKALRKRGLLPDLKKHIQHDDIENFEVGENRGSRRDSSYKRSDGNLLHLEESHDANVSLGRRWTLEVAIEKVIGHNVPLDMYGTENEENAKGPILEREYMQGILISEVVVNNNSSSSKSVKRRQRRLQEVKQPGEKIIKGHRSYDLMLSFQLGIRYTVGKISSIQKRELKTSDFGANASIWMNFRKQGSQLTPPHQSQDFRWKSYCPMVFRNLREMFKLDAADYMMSICGNDGLRELSSPGKSGSVFFLSQDDRFMIKTLRKSEVMVLLRMLPDYLHHVRTYDNTLITKFFGLHRIKPSSGQKFRFVVMGNMFCTDLRIHRRFDLKGSSLGRSTDKVEIDETTTLKDLDLNYSFHLEPSWRTALLKQIEVDSKFLEEQNIMDYSLLLGVHCRAPRQLRSLMSYGRLRTADMLGIVAEEESMEEGNSPQSLVLVPHGSNDNTVVVGPHIRGRRLRKSSAMGYKEVDLLLPGTARLQIQLGVNMPARAEHIPREDEVVMFHEAYDVVLYLGIIDILQEYNMHKKIEHAYKSYQFDSLSISSVNPKFYSNRFLQFIQKVFPPNSTPS